MATSCADLKQLGHLKNGFYTVKSPASSNKLITVYCDYTKEAGATGLLDSLFLLHYCTLFYFASLMTRLINTLIFIVIVRL